MTQDGYTPQGLLPRVRAAARDRGWRPVVGDFARWGVRTAAGLPWALRGAHGRFRFRDEEHHYLHHPYKRSWVTERAVEVPVVQALVDRASPARVLEVGNVLPHYRSQRAGHVVVDKYERAPGVLNLDVMDLAGLGEFELIVAVSTLEHVGWDESPRDPSKAPAAVRALIERLAPGGRLVLTVPVGYNPALDEALRGGALAPAEAAALRRVPGTSRWEDVAPADAWTAPYDFLVYSARAVVFAFFDAAR